MLEGGLRYPSEGEKPVGTVAVGGILVFFSWLIVPGLLLAGYVLRTIQAVAAGDPHPPRFEDWWGLLADGLRVVVLSIAFALVPMVVFIFGAIITTSGVVVGGEGGILAVATGGIVFLVGAMILFVASYLFPGSLLLLATRNSLGAAVSPRSLRSLVFRNDYVIAWLVGGAVWLVGGAIASALMVIVVGVFVQFYVSVAAAFILAQGLPDGDGSSGADSMEAGPVAG
ncbi:MAG: DUF4013 domain-containing protein [Halobacteriales archaeon]|nr:DUF4013 domain-containing protein [Halobacteriales archaeon]